MATSRRPRRVSLSVALTAHMEDAAQLMQKTFRWVQKEARPISLRQLTFFGRTLTENRLLSSANYVRTELPTRYTSYDW